MIDFNKIKNSCGSCSVRDLCLPNGVNAQELELIDETVQRSGPLARGQSLYMQGNRCENLYVVRTGAVKTVRLEQTGDEQIVGFHFCGDIIGLDGIAKDIYQVFAVAMEPTSVCQIPLEGLDELAGQIPSLRRQLFRLMSGRITDEQQTISKMGHKRVERLVADFLMNIGQRFKERGLPHTPLKLPMMRQDLANYLGIAPETLSRVFNRFQNDGLVTIHGRHITLSDPSALAEISSAPAEP